jgi:hypothetical protein
MIQATLQLYRTHSVHCSFLTGGWMTIIAVICSGLMVMTQLVRR